MTLHKIRSFKIRGDFSTDLCTVQRNANTGSLVAGPAPGLDHLGTRRAAEMKTPALTRLQQATVVISTEKFINPGSNMEEHG